MIIYNTTFNVDEQVEDQWLNWVKTDYIPMLQDTGIFTKHVFSKILVEEEMGGISYSLQLFCTNMALLKTFDENQKDVIDSKMLAEFSGKFVMFHTLLEVQDV
jgi:hypothetical protein